MQFIVLSLLQCCNIMCDKKSKLQQANSPFDFMMMNSAVYTETILAASGAISQTTIGLGSRCSIFKRNISQHFQGSVAED